MGDGSTLIGSGTSLAVHVEPSNTVKHFLSLSTNERLPSTGAHDRPYAMQSEALSLDQPQQEEQHDGADGGGDQTPDQATGGDAQ